MKKELRLSNTSLPILEVEKSDLYFPPFDDDRRSYIGNEGTIYGYEKNHDIVVKIFHSPTNKEEIKTLISKFQKVEVLGKLERDSSFSLPIGVAGYKGEKKKIGYYAQRIETDRHYKHFGRLIFMLNSPEKHAILMSGDAAMRRAHQKGLAIVDVKGNNILIDKNHNAVYVDTDGFAGLGFNPEKNFLRTHWLSDVYGKEFSMEDNDKFLYAILAIEALICDGIIGIETPDYYRELIMKLHVSKAVKNGLLEIFSDMDNKPYAGDVLKDLKLTPETKILSLKNKKCFGLNYYS